MPIQILPDPLALLRPVSKTIDASYTRPADTLVYAAGDVLAQSTSAATILTFANFGRASGQGGLIDGLTVVHSNAPTTPPDLELHLFDTAPAMQNDNVAWAPTDAEMERHLGCITIPGASRVIGLTGATGNAEWFLPASIKSIACASAATSIFGIVVVRNAYTPASAEKFTFRLHAIQD